MDSGQPNQFWQINIGHILIVLGMAASALFYVERFGAEYATLQLELSATQEKLQAVIAERDRSRALVLPKIDEATSVNDVQDLKIATLKEGLNDLQTRISDMTRLLGQISGDLAVVKSRLPERQGDAERLGERARQ